MQYVRRFVTVLGVLGMLAAAVGVAAHYIGVVSNTVTRIAAFTPLLIVCGLVAVLLLALARRRALTVLAVVVAAVGVAIQVPLFTGSAAVPDDERSISVRLMQANIMLGQADPAALVRTVAEQNVEVLTVIELTPHAVDGLRAAGIDKLLPYSFVQPRYGGGGAGIFSKFPVRDGVSLAGFELNNLEAVAEVPSFGPVAVYALHPIPPYPQPTYKWNHELRRLGEIFANQSLPLMVGADFNSTYDHRQYRDMLANSGAAGHGRVLDADGYLGSGIVATYPADRSFPAFLAIDKVLTRGGTPESFRRVDLPGSDHHGVIGDIRFERTS